MPLILRAPLESALARDEEKLNVESRQLSWKISSENTYMSDMKDSSGRLRLSWEWSWSGWWRRGESCSGLTREAWEPDGDQLEKQSARARWRQRAREVTELWGG